MSVSEYFEPSIAVPQTNSGRNPLAIARQAANAAYRRLRIRTDRRRLEEMPDHLLKDIGINRAEIYAATEYGRHHNRMRSF